MWINQSDWLMRNMKWIDKSVWNADGNFRSHFPFSTQCISLHLNQVRICSLFWNLDSTLIRSENKALKGKSYTSWEIAAHRLSLLKIKYQALAVWEQDPVLLTHRQLPFAVYPVKTPSEPMNPSSWEGMWDARGSCITWAVSHMALPGLLWLQAWQADCQRLAVQSIQVPVCILKDNLE